VRVTVLGKTWELVEVDTLPGKDQAGDCDSPDTRRKRIRVLATLSDRDRLRVLIHEMLHAAAWHQFSEEFVDGLSTDLAAALWRCGWRPTR